MVNPDCMVKVKLILKQKLDTVNPANATGKAIPMTFSATIITGR